MIEVKDLTIGYVVSRKKNKIVHSNLNFRIESGELTALLGANGVGKSTLIKSLSGFTPVIKGEVFVDGRLFNSYSKLEIAKSVGVVLTKRPVDGGLTIYDLVSLGRYPYTNYFGSLTKRDTEIVDYAIEQLGISHLKTRYISQVSDGERQKAMIAKIIAQECQTIILDEPTAFLDVKSRLETYSLLRQIAKDLNKTVVLSTHDLEAALRYADRLMILSSTDGIICGSTEDMILSGDIKRLFNETDDSNVLFDPSNGMFYIRQEGSVCISVEGGSDTLYWLKNSLVRNGYQPIEGGSAECKAHIEMLSSTEVIINSTIVVKSISEAIKYIDENI